MAEKRKVLYFIDSHSPTPKDETEAKAIAERLDARVAFRNASRVNPNEKIEENDGVAGAVPGNYWKCERVDASDQPSPEPSTNPSTETTVAPKKGRKGSAAEGWGKK